MDAAGIEPDLDNALSRAPITLQAHLGIGLSILKAYPQGLLIGGTRTHARPTLRCSSSGFDTTSHYGNESARRLANTGDDKPVR